MKSDRVNDYVPDIRFERTSILSTIRLNGGAAPFVFKGTLNGELFAAYINQVLAPTLSKGDIVIMDNCSAHAILLVWAGASWHRSKGLIIPDNIRLLSIPLATPEMNPIEQIWTWIRRHGFRNECFQTLEKVMDRLCDTIQSLSKDTVKSISARNWIMNCF